MIQQESTTQVGKSGRALGHGTVTCIDKQAIHEELEVMQVSAGDFIV